ncbi:amino acid ABC transporter substrate-binding protein [Bradyrhizobium sp. AUGA SZCCT0240]|jgi:branched-chain amino acid transport system substrate-binding protein|uniref:amino acid ABC transporter substrate-binding protein n=1 Tax=unclassified Bradyrhizobium TaxID=2631580 RepID=UPI001BA62D93|nr:MULTISPECIES: amino acid ABC transporter substrate-binding protein [unclassified Bradyrhizobium]MBR1191938.1 amino acid ABC transporter substrate-binding protein [Bradyrhizobium sp. AUGA SZCCT0160]MBR1198417.1 amino acid ABC transporter substrate-binding protein [Bradyrhizobium sp. AUGA SZCCT0158]MBR1243099.1 amino acid ABC transporter substrate-binding protein [Bradyrhizobium sp. AUGA SZCCT0274]MBR1245584.1 amino acid ABC transporter substrate-binding protein [Bradyrhizobium sp. AUGA SZCCT0
MKRRTLLGGTIGAAVLGLTFGLTSAALAQQPPIKIGMSMAQTGGLAGGGKASQLGIEIWRDDVNARGGLLGRKVELVVYDDKSSASETPAIYSKLLDVDKVDILFAPYATVPTAPLMPLVKQRGMLLMGNFSFQVNSKVGHDMWFNNAPWGPADSWAASFLELGQKAGGKTIALLAADQEFAQNLALTARDVAKKMNMQIVFDQAYPPNTVEFSSILRALKAAKPDIVYVASYPPDSAGILRAVNEIGIGNNVKIFGGGMVGLQFGAVMENLGSLLNGVVNYNTWLPEPSMQNEGTKAFFETYTKRAIEAKVDPLGYYLAPFGYASGQMIEQAIKAVGSLDQKALAKYLRENEHKTIVGPIAFAADGERKESATLQAQFRGVVDKNMDQFRKPGTQVILFPAKMKSGDLISPFEAARK